MPSLGPVLCSQCKQSSTQRTLKHPEIKGVSYLHTTSSDNKQFSKPVTRISVGIVHCCKPWMRLNLKCLYVSIFCCDNDRLKYSVSLLQRRLPHVPTVCNMTRFVRPAAVSPSEMKPSLPLSPSKKNSSFTWNICMKLNIPMVCRNVQRQHFILATGPSTLSDIIFSWALKIKQLPKRKTCRKKCKDSCKLKFSFFFFLAYPCLAFH